MDGMIGRIIKCTIIILAIFLLAIGIVLGSKDEEQLEKSEHLQLIKTLETRIFPATKFRQKTLKAMKKVDRAYYCGCQREGNTLKDCQCDVSCIYEDRPCDFKIAGQTISAPHMHLYALERLYERLSQSPPATVLDLGGGSGYVTALCHQIAEDNNISGMRIHYVDNNSNIVEFGRSNIARERPHALKNDAQNQIILHVANGFQGFLPNNVKGYDVIHVGAVVESQTLEALKQQLNPGGIMVVPVKNEERESAINQEIHVYRHVTNGGIDSIIQEEAGLAVSYVSLTNDLN